jgi:NADPH:quinone reductase-like Zn-dependent oxidoreductase
MEPTETTMHAVRMHAYGGPDVLEYEEVPLPPAPTGNQVLVRVRAAGVGPWDGAVRRGEWRGRIDYPPSSWALTSRPDA